MTVSWGSSETSADYHPLHTFNFPTTYTDDWLVGKLVSAFPPPIEKRGSWGSCLRLPHHLYRRVARGEVAESPLITPLPKLQLPHHYREEWSRGEVSLSASPPPNEAKELDVGEVGPALQLTGRSVYLAPSGTFFCQHKTRLVPITKAARPYVFKAEGGKCHCSLALPRRAAKLRLGRCVVSERG